MASNGTGLLRPQFFDRQQLAAADLNLGVEYGRERLRRHNRYLHGWGVVCGAVVAGTANPWQVQVSEGYVVTPLGDEVYIPAGAAPYDIEQEVIACLQIEPPCPDPDNLAAGRVVRILHSNIDPVGKDTQRDYNREWLQIKVLSPTNLNGYVVQHTIYPGTPRATFRTYYTFTEQTTFPAGATIRIHSGARAAHTDPEPGIEHRYVADRGEAGNWRLNNPRDTVRVLDPSGREVARRDLERSVVYLVVYSAEEKGCSQPAVPEKCRPPGDQYAFSRIREGYRLAIRCDLPPSHQQELSCATLEDIVCNRALIACPPLPAADDNGVVVAALTVSDGGLIEIDNQSPRRQLLSEALLQAFVRCHCTAVTAPPLAAFSATPLRGAAPLPVQFTDQSTGVIERWQWNFGDGESSAERNPAHRYEQPGAYTVTLAVTGPGGESTASSENLITVVATPPVAAFTAIPTSGNMPLTVAFTDQSSGEIRRRLWDFGDGATSSEATPTHVYPLPGNFGANLTVTGPGGSDSASRLIVVRFRGIDIEPGRTLPLDRVPGIGRVRMQRLQAAGINNVFALLVASPEQLAEILSLQVDVVTQLQEEAFAQLRNL